MHLPGNENSEQLYFHLHKTFYSKYEKKQIMLITAKPIYQSRSQADAIQYYQSLFSEESELFIHTQTQICTHVFYVFILKMLPLLGMKNLPKALQYAFFTSPILHISLTPIIGQRKKKNL